MMLNSKIPLPQRSISSSGLDYHSPAATHTSTTNRSPLTSSLSSPESGFPKSRIPLPSGSSSSSSSNGSSPTKKPTSPSKIPLPVTNEVQPQRTMRKYETFVMTGERMLCISKTPAKAITKSLPASPLDRVDHSPSKIPLPAATNGKQTSISSSPEKHISPLEEDDDDDLKPFKTQTSRVSRTPEPIISAQAVAVALHHSLDLDESISPSPTEDRLIDNMNDSISSSSSSDDIEEVELEVEHYDDASLRGPSMIPFNGGGGVQDPSSEGESDLESLHSYHPPPKIVDVPSAIRLAKRLYQLDGFRKSDVSRHLSRNNEYNQVVAEEYLKFFDFSNLTLDGALRLFLSQFCLTGETQERERVLFYFSKRYMECNPECKSKFLSSDAVHTLTCAIMLLNTDLHGDSGQRKMTSGEFIKNLSELNEGQDFPRELLKSLYYAIKHEPIPWALNNTVGGGEIPKEIIASVGGGGGDNGLDSFSHEDQQSRERGRSWEELYPKKDSKENSSQENLQRAATEDDNLSSNLLPKPINLGSGINPFLALPDPMSSTDYKKGYVMRKCCVDPNGKRTKLGKRSWKMFYLSLRDMVLYCFKDEKSLRAPGAFEDLNQAIRIHHGLAVRASDYTKKQFVFRLHTCDQAEYLFQTSDEKELLTWIDAINYVVASFSSPKLPAPVSSSHARFQRPLLPSSKSKLSPGEQLQENESALSELRRELEEHLQNRPPKNSSSASISFFKDKQDYLSFEVQRYETYILTLRTKYTSEQCTDDGDKSKSLERIF